MGYVQLLRFRDVVSSSCGSRCVASAKGRGGKGVSHIHTHRSRLTHRRHVEDAENLQTAHLQALHGHLGERLKDNKSAPLR